MEPYIYIITIQWQFCHFGKHIPRTNTARSSPREIISPPVNFVVFLLFIEEREIHNTSDPITPFQSQKQFLLWKLIPAKMSSRDTLELLFQSLIEKSLGLPHRRQLSQRHLIHSCQETAPRKIERCLGLLSSLSFHVVADSRGNCYFSIRLFDFGLMNFPIKSWANNGIRK